jgi:transporter family-2 protein
VSFTCGTVVLLAMTAAARRARLAVRRLVDTRDRLPWWYFIGGAGGATLVSVSAAAVPIIGVALLTVCTVTGQTVGSLVVDDVGLGPGGRRRITPARLLGAALAIGAVLLATTGRVHGEFSPGLVVAIAAAGFLVAGQQAVNGRLAWSVHDPRVAATVSFLGGTLVLALAAGALWVSGQLPALHWPSAWWLYTGGLGGALYILLTAAMVGHLGVLGVTLASVAGQLLGSVVLDAAVPTTGESLTTATVLAVALTFVAVAVSAVSQRRP